MRYKHDCKECIPIGELEKYDIYLCKKSGLWSATILRYGDNGPDYISAKLDLKIQDFPEKAQADIMINDFLGRWKES